jgi:hypothetical protein
MGHRRDSSQERCERPHRDGAPPTPAEEQSDEGGALDVTQPRCSAVTRREALCRNTQPPPLRAQPARTLASRCRVRSRRTAG